MKYNCKSISLEKDMDGRSNVGIFKEDDDYSIITPYGLMLPNSIDSKDKERIIFLKKYARCITKALSSKKVRRLLQESASAKNNPLSALNIVLDYINNGPYIEFENETVIRECGKIDFKKTISQVKPLIIDDEAFYTSFAVNRKKQDTQELVSIAQGNVINHFMENGGEILFGSMLHVPVPKISLEDANLVNRLIRAKSSSFNSRKQQLLQWIIDYIQGASNKKEKGSWQYAIVASTLWEEMIDGCYSNQTPRDKTEYGKTFTLHYYNKKDIQESSPTQHDTIYETDSVLVIIDAKMYNTAESLLTSEVLEKQFGYAEVAKSINPDKKIYNVLIKPYIVRSNEEGIVEEKGIIGYIPDNNDPNNIILIYTVEFEKVLNAYYAGKKISLELLEDLNEFESTLKEKQP